MLNFFNIILNSISFFFNNLASSSNIILADASEPWQLGFQDPATSVMSEIINFHYDLMAFIIVICVFVCWVLYSCIALFKEDLNKTNTRQEEFRAYSQGISHHTNLEIAWTLAPAVILLFIAVPSFALLYNMESLTEPSLTVKVTGNQWYWQYEYNGSKDLDGADYAIDGQKFDSYMTPSDDLEEGQLRLLEVDNRLQLPINTHVQMVITSSDVLHCWAVPSLGVKVDACPGRLNQTTVFIQRPGTFYGQCSEICGQNHGFMPIVVEGLSMKDFLAERHMSFLLAKLDDDPDFVDSL